MNWFAVTPFTDQAIFTPVFKLFITTIWQKNWSAARNIHDNEALAKLAKNFKQVNKSWFTVYTLDIKMFSVCLISVDVPYNMIFQTI